MKLWKISQDVNNDYDTYDSAVVAAETEEIARCIPPGAMYAGGRWPADIWAPVDKVVEYIGEAKPGTASGVIVASFNAG